MRAINGNVIIKLQHTMNDRTESGLYKDTTFDRHGKMMIYAEAISVSQTGSDHVMLEVITGEPRSKEVEPVYVRNKEVKHDIRVGDRVYFHYLTLEDPQNYLKWEYKWGYYKVPIHDIFLSIRPDEFGDYESKGERFSAFMHNEYVMGKEYWGEGWTEVDVGGKKVAGKINGLGLVTETKDMPMENYATITDIGRGIKPYQRSEVEKGDVVLIVPHCEFKNEVERQERWIFTHQDILGKLVNGKVFPVCDYILVKMKEREHVGKVVVDPNHLEYKNEGTIVEVGEKVDQELFEIGAEISFHPKGKRVLYDKTHVLVRECHVHAITKFAL